MKVNDGSVYLGVLICIDGNLNTVLEGVTLYQDMQQATDGKSHPENETFGEVFIRGNNVCYMAPKSKQ